VPNKTSKESLIAIYSIGKADDPTTMSPSPEKLPEDLPAKRKTGGVIGKTTIHDFRNVVD
jgi:hypothetical protein